MFGYIKEGFLKDQLVLLERAAAAKIASVSEKFRIELRDLKTHCMTHDKLINRTMQMKHNELLVRVKLLEKLHENEIKEFAEQESMGSSRSE